jgi:hypothetical protein
VFSSTKGMLICSPKENGNFLSRHYYSFVCRHFVVR